MRSRPAQSPIIFESGQFSSILSMVGTGMGVSIVPEMAIDKRQACRYVRIADSEATRTIALSSSADVLSLVSNSPFFGACAARLPEFYWAT